MYEPTTTDHKKLEQLAGYLAHGINPAQAGAAVGYSKERVEHLMQDEGFLQMLTDKSAAMAEQYATINSRYDEIEKQALDNLLQNIRMSRDPDMALRAATLANRAVRRGQNVGQPLNPANATGALNINLSFKFVQKIQNNEVRIEPRNVKEIQNQLDTASPAIVQQLLTQGIDPTKKREAKSMVEAGILDIMAPVD